MACFGGEVQQLASFRGAEGQPGMTARVAGSAPAMGTYGYPIDSTIPPSTRSAAPVVAEACGEQA